MNFKQRLATFLSTAELEQVKTSFDNVGSIAILTIPDELFSKENEIAQALLESEKRIKTVLRKEGGHEGEFRTQPLKHLAGEKTKETIHIELGTRIKVNVETVYFTPRLSTERERILQQIKDGEKILVMFSGCGIYPCVFAKKSKAAKIVGIEINPEGYKYALENIKLNKIQNVELHLGDIHDIAPKLREKFDRIVMPLPASAHEFLEDAFSVSKKGTIIHFYAFEEEKTMPQKTVELVLDSCKKNKVKANMVSWAKCGPSKPRWYRICVDIQVE